MTTEASKIECYLCMSGFGTAEHAVLLAIAELDKGDGVSEDKLMEYCNAHLVNLTIKELHERMKKHDITPFS